VKRGRLREGVTQEQQRNDESRREETHRNRGEQKGTGRRMYAEQSDKATQQTVKEQEKEKGMKEEEPG